MAAGEQRDFYMGRRDTIFLPQLQALPSSADHKAYTNCKTKYEQPQDLTKLAPSIILCTMKALKLCEFEASREKREKSRGTDLFPEKIKG